MNIDIDTQEYRDLLDIVHIADVVLSGHGGGDAAHSERHRVLIQKLYALAKDAGLDQLMNFDGNVKKYVPTPAFEQSTLAHRALNQFGEHLFWEHLINRLAQRDAGQMTGGIERTAGMEEQDRHRLFHAIRKRYAEEFQANDIVNLRLVVPLEQGAEIPVKTSD